MFELKINRGLDNQYKKQQIKQQFQTRSASIFSNVSTFLQTPVPVKQKVLKYDQILHSYQSTSNSKNQHQDFVFSQKKLKDQMKSTTLPEFNSLQNDLSSQEKKNFSEILEELRTKSQNPHEKDLFFREIEEDQENLSQDFLDLETFELDEYF